MFVLANLLPKRASNSEEIYQMLEKRRTKRLDDQRRRQDKARRSRPPVGDLEKIPK
jgi:hypothetical protein